MIASVATSQNWIKSLIPSAPKSNPSPGEHLETLVKKMLEKTKIRVQMWQKKIQNLANYFQKKMAIL
jgi:hypothetical protein